MFLRALGSSKLGNILTGKGVLKARKGVVRAGRVYNDIDKNVYFWSILLAISVLLSISTINLALMVLIQEIIYLE